MYGALDAAALVKACPSLRFIIYYRKEYEDSDSDEEEDDDSSMIRTIGDALIVRQEAFRGDLLYEKYKTLSPILVPYNDGFSNEPLLTVLSRHYRAHKELIKYSVKELGFDLNFQ